MSVVLGPLKCWRIRVVQSPARQDPTISGQFQFHPVVSSATRVPHHFRHLSSAAFTSTSKAKSQLWRVNQSKEKRTRVYNSGYGAQSVPTRDAQPSPGGSAGEDTMSADLRHMREAGPIGDSAAGVAGAVSSAEDLDPADETAEQIGSPPKTALAGDYGPGASAVNPGVNSKGEIDYSKAAVQPGSVPPSSMGSRAPRNQSSTVQETDTAPAAQGLSGQEKGSTHEAMAETFEAQAAREPEALSDQVAKAPGTGADISTSEGAASPEPERTSEGNVSLVPDEDLVGSKSSGRSDERAGAGRKDLNDTVGPTHQAL